MQAVLACRETTLSIAEYGVPANKLLKFKLIRNCLTLMPRQLRYYTVPLGLVDMPYENTLRVFIVPIF
jgi:hypothetical protein